MTSAATLSVDGGLPVREKPLPPWPHFDEEQVEAAAAVLASGKVNYWTGPEGGAYEAEFAALCRREHGLAVANGTVALELVVTALGIGPGDDVVVTPRTFIASVACVAAAGARPVFADVDPISQAITAENIEAVLTPQTRAVIPVHLGGWPADMPAIVELAAAHGFEVIEDAAQAHGASVDGLPVGSFGSAAAFSTCQDKIITTGGEGGVVVTSDADLWGRMWSERDHGKDFAAVHAPDHAPGFRWVHHRFGTNARLTEVQAALGRIQLRRLPQWLALRRRNAAILDAACADVPGLRVTEPPERIGHAYYKHSVFVRPEGLRPGWDRDRVMEAINAEGIPCYSGSCPEVYLEKAFDARFRPPVRLPVARELGETSLMFLVHPTLEPEDMEHAAAAITKVMAHASA